jgi:hypothetical protein
LRCWRYRTSNTANPATGLVGSDISAFYARTNTTAANHSPVMVTVAAPNSIAHHLYADSLTNAITDVCH